MAIDTRVVSRKTPGDGMLEIASATAERLAALGSGLTVALAGETAPATVEAMSCTCGKREGGHVHHFLSSALLRRLEPGARIALHLDAAARRVTLQSTPEES